MIKEKNIAVRKKKNKRKKFMKIYSCLFQKGLMEMTDFA